MGSASRGGMGDAGSGSRRLIAADTSVLVRYLVGTPAAQARQAAKLIDDDELEIGVSPVALAECAHVLRTQYDVPARDVIDSLIDLVQRENIRMLGLSTELVVQHLVRARSMPGDRSPTPLSWRPPSRVAPMSLATFDRDQRRYGIPIRQP